MDFSNAYLDNEIDKLTIKYMNFLNYSKTERETITTIKILIEENGFKDLNNYNELKTGDKVYYINKNKNMFLAVIGDDDIDNGFNTIVAHADSPRLDLKPNPLYEKEGMAYFKTHYYGSIKNYQWTTIPLAIHGVVVKTNGEKINIVIGENDDEPVMVITDLLPHLASEQMEGKMKNGITGEDLNLLIGHLPIKKNETNQVKNNIMKILKEKYNIIEKDFVSAELEIVPAFKCREVGIDKSMIGGYGQDNKASVFLVINALMNIKNNKKTAIAIITDREEVGSLGNTSINSKAFDLFISELYKKIKGKQNFLSNYFYHNSKVINADVDIAFDPIYESLFELHNTFFLGKGITINKYPGINGKEDCSEASAEYVAFIRKLLEENDIDYQVGEGGKIDAGGGASDSYVLANKGMDVIDCGIPLLSMHSPFEIISKYDMYRAYKFFKIFYEN